MGVRSGGNGLVVVGNGLAGVSEGLVRVGVHLRYVSVAVRVHVEAIVSGHRCTLVDGRGREAARKGCRCEAVRVASVRLGAIVRDLREEAGVHVGLLGHLRDALRRRRRIVLLVLRRRRIFLRLRRHEILCR